jgi:hypothetical protein
MLFYYQGIAMFSLTSPISPLALVLGAIFCVVAAGVVAYIGQLLVSAFSQSFGGVFERAAFQRCSARCARGDELLEKGDHAGAMQAFAEAFFLRPIRREADLLSDVANYHTGLLSRLLTIADELGKGRVRLLSLARTDRLLAERLEIQLDYFRAIKRGERERLRDIERRLRENQTQVRTVINRLIEEIRSSEEKVLYH